ncbi:MAG: lysylphosphatidylglycerol synthase domain-containing protein [Hyphomonadaceae bacterium]
MNTPQPAKLTVRWGAGRLGAMAHLILSLAAAAALGYLAFATLPPLLSGGMLAVDPYVSGRALLLAAGIYVVGHAFRAMRLALLIGGWDVGLRLIASFHFMSAGVSLAAPLKLGEVYRIAELSNLIGAFTRAVEIVWWERVLDVLALVVIMLVAMNDVSNVNFQPFMGVLVIALVFICVSALALFVLPDNLRRASILIIRRYDSRVTIPLLKFIAAVRGAILEAPRLVQGKIGSLAALTLLIWTCEIGCLAEVLSALGYTIAQAPDSLLSFLSVLARGETLVSVLNAHGAAGGDPVLEYLPAAQEPLVLLSLLAGGLYLVQRLRRRATAGARQGMARALAKRPG